MTITAENNLEYRQGKLFVHAIEEKAQWIPNNMYMRYAPDDWLHSGYKTITWKQYASAIDKMAFWFDERLGKAVDCETIAYFGPNDPRYAILIPAIVKNGRKPLYLLIPDGRVTKEGLAGLIKASSCKVWLYPEDDAVGPLVDADSGLKLCALPSLEWMLDNGGQKRYTYDKTFGEAKWDEIVIIHTSGTTDSPCVMTPRDEVSLTPNLFKKIVSMNRIEGISLYADPETRQMLKSLDFIVYTGAPLDRAIGDDLCQHTRLSPMIGSTENGDQIGLRPADRKLWYTHDFVPENGHRMVPLDAGSDGLHELILEQVGDGRTNPFQTSFWNTAHRFLERIETKELYRPVKDSDGRTRWAFSARKDDLTKLSWLAKFHAQDIERRILQHPDVENVLVGGEARPAPYVIVQAKEGVLDGKSEVQLLDELYDGVIAATNKADLSEIRIPRETIMIAKKEKPLKVSLKQLVQRKAVEQDYSEEIEQAYVRLENSRKP
ncbi:uncharacterized protein J4E92_005894 [Alternaria infectoria]|uniref:uncharacterized protein n=1 Tax=Alternaria infectoria TaxID=45303 RepID=UPI00221F201C|nr:uncharacterized protein J4E92_005894 [Alternaria infectoria]KAI4928408.1 hypothetical protein J4E92_005894 [Alternaria infectoria]